MRLAICFLALILAGSAEARTLRVPADGTLRYLLANTTSGDTISVSPGVYTGPEYKDMTFGGQNLTLIGDHAIFDGQDRGRFMYVSNADLIVEGLEFRNFNLNFGAGFTLLDASLVMKDCAWQNCRSAYGSCVAVSGSTVVLENCVFDNNTAGYAGSVVLGSNASIIASRCIFSNNYGPSIAQLAPCTGSLTCCDLWNAQVEPWVVQADGLTLDPEYCDGLRVRDASSLRGASCGSVGLLEPCASSSVPENCAASWGRLRYDLR